MRSPRSCRALARAERHNPESVSDPRQGVLWWQQLPSGDGGGVPGEHTSRLFMWHVNETGRERNLGLTLENRGTEPLQVLRLRH